MLNDLCRQRCRSRLPPVRELKSFVRGICRHVQSWRQVASLLSAPGLRSMTASDLVDVAEENESTAVTNNRTRGKMYGEGSVPEVANPQEVHPKTWRMFRTRLC